MSGLTRVAVCYIATAGYLFQTVVSAVQARRHSPGDAEVFVFFLGDGDHPEAEVFSAICAEHGIRFTAAPAELLHGLHPTYARFFLGDLLPPGEWDVLYLDGDTQIVSSLEPLLRRPTEGGVLAARDPMVLLRTIHPRLRGHIDSWWDESGIPSPGRHHYVNAGILRFSTAVLPRLRADVLAIIEDRPGLHFLDQDALNLSGHLAPRPLSMRWNFPGFLLGTPVERQLEPCIIHFMSSPRPWGASLPPWGATHHAPYTAFAQEHPAAIPYWERYSARQRQRYRLQQAYKTVTEGRFFRTARAGVEAVRLEEDALLRAT